MDLYGVGNYTNEGFGLFSFQEGTFLPISHSSSLKDSSYLAYFGNAIYAITEDLLDSSVGVYKVGVDYSISLLEQIKTIGKGPCYVTIDPKRKLLYVAYYGDGSFSVYPIQKNGKLKTCCYHKIYGLGSHVHHIAFTPNFNYVFVVDLGLNRLLCYKVSLVNTSFALTLISEYSFPIGTKPRHISVLSSHHLCVITEGSCELFFLSFSCKSGLQFLSSCSLFASNSLMQEGDTGCAIKASKDVKFLYASIRHCDTLCVFKKRRNSYSLIQSISCHGKTPRDFCFDPTQHYLFCANQDSSTISIFCRDDRKRYFVLFKRLFYFFSLLYITDRKRKLFFLKVSF